MSTVSAIRSDLAALYRRAFAEFGVEALWNMRPVDDPGPGDAMAITRALRTHGRMEECRPAEAIERIRHAAQ